ncbi:MAG: ATP-binding domain-containing protein, partial [Proteobacteria bacterium]|nr:ATP-binding domain-containing protein [Pseudomonadota bacterium]
DVVIILGMEDGIFPEIWHWRPEAIQEERLKEERRLFYVAMTRAKKRLYLSTSMYRFYEKQGDQFLYDRAASYNSEDQNRAASVFIHEIPSDYIQKWSPRQK